MTKTPRLSEESRGRNTYQDAAINEESRSSVELVTKTPRLSEESRGINTYQDAAFNEESRSSVVDNQDAATSEESRSSTHTETPRFSEESRSSVVSICLIWERVLKWAPANQHGSVHQSSSLFCFYGHVL